MSYPFDDGIRKFLGSRNLIPSFDEEITRHQILRKMEKIVSMWIVEVAHSKPMIDDEPSAHTIPYGSYGLQAHSPGSDLDIVVVGPSYATLEVDFLIGLSDVIRTFQEATDIECISTAKVPLIKFNMHNIHVEVTYARLTTKVVKAKEMRRNLFGMIPIGKASGLAFSSLLVNLTISRYMPRETQVERYIQAVRLIKLWAKCRGLYGNVVGYMGGIHLAVMMAVIVRDHPEGSLANLVLQFFRTFSSWEWPLPIILESNRNIPYPPANLLLPIQKPGANEYLQSNVKEYTRRRIIAELNRGMLLTQELLCLRLTDLCHPFDYTSTYCTFLKIRVSTAFGTDSTDSLERWTGFARSRFPDLLDKLSELDILCYPTLMEYRDNIAEPNTVFLWGVISEIRNNYKLPSIRNDWKASLVKGYTGYEGAGDIYLSIVPRSRYATYSRWKLAH